MSSIKMEKVTFSVPGYIVGGGALYGNLPRPEKVSTGHFFAPAVPGWSFDFCTVVVSGLTSVHIPGGMRPEARGISHGLKKCPPDTFSPRLCRGRPFDSRTANKKGHPNWMSFFVW